MTDFVAFQLQVDVANPKDVREKLPRAERALADMEREIADMQARVDRWKALVEGLRSVAGLPGPATSAPLPAANGRASVPTTTITRATTVSQPSGARGRAQMQALILGAMAEIGRPIKSSDLAVYLAALGHAFSLDSVSNALWYAADRGNIRKVQRGVYAPLDPDAAPDIAPPTPPPAASEDDGTNARESALRLASGAALTGAMISAGISALRS